MPKVKMFRPALKAFHSVTGELVVQTLPHLNAETACKHVFVLSQDYTHAPRHGGYGPGWFVNPIPPLDQALRLSYSNLAPRGWIEVSSTSGRG